MTAIFYPAIVERGHDGFGVFFPDLPGCVAAGDTVQEAVVNAEEALALHLVGIHESGDDIPLPTSIDTIKHDPDVDEVGRILVRGPQAFAAQTGH